MPAIVYLDPEDEITSAAMRIRQAPDPRVALVVPFGSRVATSRINFRLLAREAMRDGRRLDIVAPDASARALAASAGLPVFASVGEYEAALDEAARPEPAGEAAAGAAGAAAGATAAGAAGLAAAAGAAAAAGTPPEDVPVPRARSRASLPAGAVGGFAADQAADSLAAGRTPEQQAELDAVVQRSREAPLVPRPGEPPIVRKPRRRLRAGLFVGFALLVVALGVAAVAAYLFLPAATITITPEITPVGPISLSVTADPAATSVDAATLVIPAQTVDVPVEVSGEFAATGKRVEKTPATGAVRWSNCDPTASYTIPKGTQVRTAGGVAFALDESVFLPVAIISGGGSSPTLKCQSSEVAVTAVKAGPDGNVDAGTIRVVPSRYNRNVIRVTNPNPTTGGTETTFTRIARKDVDAALASLEAELESQFQEELGNPGLAPPGSTVYPETAVLGEATPTEDPDALVGQEVESFTLGLDATGTVVAVDPSPIDDMAAEQIVGQVSPGAELVQGSTQVAVGEGSVGEDSSVSFPVTVTAREQTPVDAGTAKSMVLGMTVADAEAALAPYGEISVVLWPGWAVTVPTIEQRVDVIVNAPVDAPGPDGGGSGEQPVPSG